jgi:hypothetical protein
MNEEKELILSITEANSLKKITKTPGWKIIEDFLDKSLEKYSKELKSEDNNNLANIMACRKIIGWIDDFRKVLVYNDIGLGENQEELKIIKKKGDNI